MTQGKNILSKTVSESPYSCFIKREHTSLSIKYLSPSQCLIVATSATEASATQEQRQTSQNSTLSESIDSAGGGVVPCSRETSTLYMVDQFMLRVMEIWNTSAPLEYLPSGRQLALQWAGYVPLPPPLFTPLLHTLLHLLRYPPSDTYSLPYYLLIYTRLILVDREGPNVSFAIGKETKYTTRVTAISDGCFRIAMLNTEHVVAPVWPRQKAAVLLEVTPDPSPPLPLPSYPSPSTLLSYIYLESGTLESDCSGVGTL